MVLVASAGRINTATAGFNPSVAANSARETVGNPRPITLLTKPAIRKTTLTRSMVSTDGMLIIVPPLNYLA